MAILLGILLVVLVVLFLIKEGTENADYYEKEQAEKIAYQNGIRHQKIKQETEQISSIIKDAIEKTNRQNNAILILATWILYETKSKLIDYESRMHLNQLIIKNDIQMTIDEALEALIDESRINESLRAIATIPYEIRKNIIGVFISLEAIGGATVASHSILQKVLVAMNATETEIMSVISELT